MVTVYVFGNAPAQVRGVTRDLRILWALEECGLPYRLHPLDYERGELKQPAYTCVQPFGQIPALDDAGFRLFESGAMLLYIAEKSGQLLPATPAGRTLAWQWMFAAANTVEPPLAQLFAMDAFSADEAWAQARRPAVEEKARAVLAALDGELARRPYLLGDAFAIPDVLMTTVLHLVAHTDLVRERRNVAAYQQRCESRPAWQKVFATRRQPLAA